MAKRLADDRGPFCLGELVALGFGEAEGDDFGFDAAVLGMVVFADAVGDVDEAALGETESGGADGLVPADGADGCGAGDGGVGVLGEFEAEVALLHGAGSGDEAGAAGEKDGFGIAVAEGLEFAQPADENRRDAIEGQLCVNAEEMLGLGRAEALKGVEAETALEFR